MTKLLKKDKRKKKVIKFSINSIQSFLLTFLDIYADYMSIEVQRTVSNFGKHFFFALTL